MTPARILVIDDDLALLHALPDTLQLRLYRVVIETAGCVERALELAARHDYDLILTDLKMPKVAAFDLLRQLTDLRPTTPVILMTGHGTDEIVKQAVAFGAACVLSKPLDREQLIRQVKGALREKRSLRGRGG